MPFQLPEPTVTIAIEDGGPFHGAEAQVRQTAAWSVYRSIGRLLQEFVDAEGVGPEDEALQALYGLFADHLISWNLTDHKDDPIPATADGLNRLPVALALLLIGEWSDVGVGYVPGPLSDGSNDGSVPSSTPTPKPASTPTPARHSKSRRS